MLWFKMFLEEVMPMQSIFMSWLVLLFFAVFKLHNKYIYIFFRFRSLFVALANGSSHASFCDEKNTKLLIMLKLLLFHK